MAMDGFADRLTEAVQRKGTAAVVAVDPVFRRLPQGLSGASEAGDSAAEISSIVDYCRELIGVVAPIVPAVKINSAYFEPYRGRGVDAYYELVREARAAGLLVIGDVKRGDVGHSAERYAQAHLGGAGRDRDPVDDIPDAVTISGYLGLDGVRPFVEAASAGGRGVFVLVRTSNPSAAAVQDVELGDGHRLHDLMASLVASWAAESETVGNSGYSAIGAVVATRDSADAARLRKSMPQSIFLVPGYGAQGGTAADTRPYFRPDGTGAIIVGGRSVIYAYDRPGMGQDSDWKGAVRSACEAFAREIAALTGT